MRIATFNLENLDDVGSPSLEERIRVLRPQLLRVEADVLCLQEVHSTGSSGDRTLAALDALLAGTPYAGRERRMTLTTGGDFYHERNLVTISRYPVLETRILRDNDGPQPRYQLATASPPDQSADAIGWERPLLYTRLDVDGTPVHVVNLHLKSKLASSIPGQKIDNFTWRSASAWAEGFFVSSMKRVGQALQVRLLVDDLFGDDPEARICIVGDFNAEIDEVPMRAILGRVEETGNPEHAPFILIPCENNVPESNRFSLYHLGKGEMIDHVLASRPLFGAFRGAEIHNEALPDESGAFRQDVKFPESDHAPVVAVFDL